MGVAIFDRGAAFALRLQAEEGLQGLSAATLSAIE